MLASVSHGKAITLAAPCRTLEELASSEALTAGCMADADPPARQSGALTPEREAELEQKYRFSTSWGFRSN